MNIVIRTDASIEIGTGHVMRCLTLAKQLKRHGAEVTFVCRELEGNSISYLQGEGMNVAVLPSSNDSFQWKLDAEATIAVIKEKKIKVDLVIVDHYRLDSRWESRLRCCTKKIMVIDDLADRSHDCDLLLDQTFGEDEKRYVGLYPECAIGLFGVKYAILRNQFLNYRKSKFNYNQYDIKIHLFFGGIDLHNYTTKFSKIILSNFSNVTIKAIVGRGFKFVSDLNYLEYKFGSRFEWKRNVENMAEQMYQCDLAFGAPGTATWERACVGLPSAYIAVSENQIEILSRLQERELCVFLGKASTVQPDNIISKLDEMFTSPKLLNTLFLNSIHNVDGLGTERIIKTLKEMIGD